MVTDEQARSAAEAILSAPEYTRWEGAVPSWLALLDRIGDWIPDWLIAIVSKLGRLVAAFFERLGEILGLFGFFGEVGRGVGWIALCLILASAIALVRVWRSRRERAAVQAASRPGTRSGHAEALREARALAASGRYLEAAHRVQLATLALLISFDWLELARSDPNRTLRQRLAKSPLPERERRQLIRLVDRLEALWFDEPRQDSELFDEWMALDERILSLAASGKH